MLSSCFGREGVTSQPQFAWENNTMNITVADGGVQAYDDLVDFSPVDSSSVWEVCTGTEDFGAVDFSTIIKNEFNDSCANGPSFAEDSHGVSSLLPWGFSMQPLPTLKSSNKRSIRDILREVTVSEEALQSAVARLGGGAQGLKVLMDHVYVWTLESHDADAAAIIRKGILDLGNTPANYGGVNANVQWKNHGNRGSTICEPTNRGAAYTRALRKSHMVRQWRHSPRAQLGSNKYGHQSRAHWRTGSHQSWLQDLEPELGNANGKGYEFLFQKELRASDVSTLGRIILPKKDAEKHLPFLYEREGMMITLEDYHSGAFWTVRYRFWPNNKSRMYLLETIGGFVNYHHLQEGDFLICYRNRQGGYVIRGQKVPPNVKASAKGLSPKGSQGRETTEKTETKTVNSTSMPPKHQFLDGDQSTTDSNSDPASSSFESTFRGLSDGPQGFEDAYGRQESCISQQIDYRYNIYEDEGPKTDGFVTASPKLLASHDSGFDPVVEMLAVSNVKQRYLDGGILGV
ncbi:hypothetical protein KC19_2G192800 [Ceratodon purpureus]|uniref:TF-B3 domain-containing protein n=1 Tax=Ceratodon purpureus TaxID=3225 RepID=A0A8T0IX88_CERPU|nr:hypothetical protein KC19_2G192800 [Ceratodon purpureus]